MELNPQRLKQDKYLTITVLAYHAYGKLHFSGLHQNILFYRKKTNNVDTVETTGIWIGIMDDISEALSNDYIDLNIGDTLLLFTKGIIETWTKASIKDHRNEKAMLDEKR